MCNARFRDKCKINSEVLSNFVIWQKNDSGADTFIQKKGKELFLQEARASLIGNRKIDNSGNQLGEISVPYKLETDSIQ